MAVYELTTPNGTTTIVGFTELIGWIRKPLSKGYQVRIRKVSDKRPQR